MIFSRAIARATLAVALSLPAWADSTGLVVSVHDGDTLTVLVDKQQIKVRLAEISHCAVSLDHRARLALTTPQQPNSPSG